MFERYTDGARRALFHGRYEATQIVSLSIDPEHILLGVLRERNEIASQILAGAHLEVDDVRREVERLRGSRERLSLAVEIPFSSETKRVLHFAAEEADRVMSNDIGVEHLLLGILRDEASAAASILNEHGIRLDAAREQVVVWSSNVSQTQAAQLEGLKLRLSGYTKPGQELFRNVLFDQLFASLPKDSQVKVQIYNAEIAPGGHTNWHCHNGATFFVALQGIFEAEFREGVLIKAKAGDVYSEPIAKIHRGHNPHPEVPYLCIGFCITAPDRDHVTNVEKPW